MVLDAASEIALTVRLHRHLLDRLHLDRLAETPRAELRPTLLAVIADSLANEDDLPEGATAERLIDGVIAELLGFGPLEPLLTDETISDILITTHEVIYVERQGRLSRSELRFHDAAHLMRIINRMVASVGRRVDEATPMVDARLADGSRVNVVIPPLAVDGPLVSIRKFTVAPLSLARLVELGGLTDEMARVLAAMVIARRNLVISGGSGSGKTTLLGALSAFIDRSERIITIEDAAELRLQHPHVGRLETRPPNFEGRGEVEARPLLRNALRMRPDRIIVGEVRAGEAFDMLQAMNSGQDGSMTTVHANTPRDAIWRIEQLVGMAGMEMPLRSVREQIASAVHAVVHLERMEDGVRRITAICEVAGLEGGNVQLRELYRYRRGLGKDDEAAPGAFEATGMRSLAVDMLAARRLKPPGLEHAS